MRGRAGAVGPGLRAALACGLFWGVIATASAQQATAPTQIPLPAQRSAGDVPAPRDAENQALSVDEARALYQQHERQLDRIEGERVNVEETVTAKEAEREKLNARLLEIGQKTRESETRLTALEKEMAELRRREAELAAQLKEQHREIGDLLAVMQRMGREPPPVMVTQREDALRMVRSGMLLNSFFPALKTRADSLVSRLTELSKLRTEKQTQAEKLQSETEELAELRARTKDLIAERQEQVSRQRTRLAALDRAADRHASAISDLSQLLKTLDSEVAAQTGLGAYERELESGDIVELKPQAKQAAFVQPGRMKPAVPFSQAKGLLKLPASGSIIRDFGDSDDLGLESHGVSIETRESAQVYAPADGWVSFAGEFRSYGQLLIINAGGGYHVLLAGMKEIYVRRGQFVLSGEPVGSMGGASVSADASGNQTRQSLYVEFRKNEEPIDPKPWWASDLAKG